MRKILFNDYAPYQEDIYFFDTNYGIPGKINKTTGKVLYINKNENIDILLRESIDITISQNGTIIGLQNNGNGIWIYDIEKKACKRIDIECGHDKWNNFAFAYGQDSSIFIFPRFYNEMLKLDLKDETISSQTCLTDKNYAWMCGCLVDNRIFVCPFSGNRINIFNLQTKQFEGYDVGEHMENIVSCTSDGKNLYILNKFGKIYMLDISNFSIKIIRDVPKDNISNKTVGKLLYASNKLIILPSLADEITLFDLEAKSIKTYVDYPNDFEYYNDFVRSRYYGCCEDEKYYYLLGVFNYMLLIEKASGAFLWKKIYVPEDEELINVLKSYGILEFGEKNYSIKGYIKSITPEFENISRKDVPIGSLIWDNLNN